MDINFKSKSKYFAEIAIIAAIYIVLTVGLSFISYSNIQFRISEALLVLVLFRKSAIPGLILGCFIANLFGPLGIPDLIFGTLGTVIAVWGIYMLREKNILVALLPGIVANTIFVGLELKIFLNIPFFVGSLGVLIGETVVLYTLGVLFFYALKKLKFASDYENVL
ncbi:MAG: QueT transporter family protein [Fusobacteria bacterium]|nr:QueT transporter family protein [Fusobacteriota bacterium]